jgi:hypothetical protein
MEEENYAQFVCIEIASVVNKQISTMMGLIGNTAPGKKKKKNRHDDSPERRGTEATSQRIEDTGTKTENDESGDNLSEDEKINKIEKFLKNLKVDDDSVEETLGEILHSGLQYSISHASMDNDAFFTVDSVAGAILITLNTRHAAFSELFANLETDTDGMSNEELNHLIIEAQSALFLMLIAWARLEDEASGNILIRLQDTRKDWGRIARDFLLYGRDK